MTKQQEMNEQLWKEKYELSKKYYEEYNNLEIPQGYKINNVNLGDWISKQRIYYKQSKLSQERIDLLDKIGMVWEYKFINHTSINEQIVCHYLLSNGIDFKSSYKALWLVKKELDVFIPSINVAIEYDGFRWHQDVDKDLEKNKLCHDNGVTLFRIRENKCPVLNSTSIDIVMKNNTYDGLEEAIKELFCKLNDEFGLKLKSDINIPRDYPQIIKLLNENNNNAVWNEYYKLAKEFYKQNGHLIIVKKYRVNNLALGEWISRQRRVYRGRMTGILTKGQINKLNKIGMVWDELNNYEEDWENNYKVAEEYYNTHSDLNVPALCLFNNFKLGLWIRNQRKKYKNNKLTNEQINKLEKIKMVWVVKSINQWEINYEICAQYFKINGNIEIPHRYIVDNIKIGQWLAEQKRKYNNPSYKKGKLTNEQIEKLEKLNIQWKQQKKNSV